MLQFPPHGLYPDSQVAPHFLSWMEAVFAFENANNATIKTVKIMIFFIISMEPPEHAF
jgi:surfactin synthase thioesterase subunit